MPRRGRQHKRINDDGHVVEAGEARVEGEDCAVETALLDLPQQRLGLVFTPHDVQIGQVFAQRRRHLGQQVRTDGRDDAEPQRAPQRIALLPRRGLQILDGHQHLPRPRDERLAPLRHPHAAGVALEHLHAERAFDLRHLRAQRGLGDTAGLRGPAEPAEIGDGDKILQLPHRERRLVPQCHSHRLSL